MGKWDRIGRLSMVGWLAVLAAAAGTARAQTGAPQGPPDEYLRLVAFDEGPSTGLFLNAGASIPVSARAQVSSGWLIEAGARRISQPGDDLRLLFDYGGLFTANSGGDGSAVASGVFYAPFDDHTHALDNFFVTEVESVRRFQVEVAGGALWSPSLFSTGKRRLSITARFGPRIGFFNASYAQTHSDDLVALEVLHAGHGHDPRLFQFRSPALEDGYARDAGFVAGVFGSVGTGVTWHDVSLLGLPWSEVNLGAEVQFAHDWFDLGDFASDFRGLTTISPLLTLSVGY